MVSGEALNLETAIAQLSDLKREFDALESATVNAQQKLSLVIEQLKTLSFDQSNAELSHNVEETSTLANSNVSLLSDQVHTDLQMSNEMAIADPTPKAIDADTTEIAGSETLSATADAETEAYSSEPIDLLYETEEELELLDGDATRETEAAHDLSLSDEETEDDLSNTGPILSETDEADGVLTRASVNQSECDATEHDNLTDELEPTEELESTDELESTVELEQVEVEPATALTLSEFQVEETLFDGTDDEAQSLTMDASGEDAPELVEPKTVAEECADEVNSCEADANTELTEIELLIASFEDDENNPDDEEFLISTDYDIGNSTSHDIMLAEPENDADCIEANEPASEQSTDILEDAECGITKTEQPVFIGEYDCDIGTLAGQDCMADEDCHGNMHQEVAFDTKEAAKDFELSTEFGDNVSDEQTISGASDVELDDTSKASELVETLPAATSIDQSEAIESSPADANVDAATTENEDATEMAQSTSTVLPFPTSQEQAIAAPRKTRRRRVFATATGIAASIAAFAFALQVPEVQQLQDLPHVDQILQRISDLQRYLA